MANRGHLGIVFERIIILIYQFAAQLVRIFGGSLPQERGQVVIERSLSATLIINEIRIALCIEHHIACLKITIHETVVFFGHKVFGKQTEISLKFQFMKIKVGRFQKTILEIIQVEQHAVLIKFGLRITLLPFQSSCSPHLDIGQRPDGFHKQLFFILVISATGLSSSRKGMKEGLATQISNNITQFVIINGKNCRHRQLSLCKMA